MEFNGEGGVIIPAVEVADDNENGDSDADDGGQMWRDGVERVNAAHHCDGVTDAVRHTDNNIL